MNEGLPLVIRILEKEIDTRKDQIWTESHKFVPDKDLVSHLQEEFWKLRDFKTFLEKENEK